MSKLSSSWTTSSVALFICVISISCVFGVPLFPDKRRTNDSARIFGILSYWISSCFLAYETRIHQKVIALRRAMKKLYFKCMGKDYNVHPKSPCNHNLLAWFFFIGYLLSELWNLANQSYFALGVNECFEVLRLIANGTKLVLAIILMITIIFPNPPPKYLRVSIFGWSFVSGVCLSSAFKYIVEEVTWGYLDIVEKSIHDPEYGLNITNYTSVEEYVQPIFKLRAHCIEHVILKEIAEYILEFIPFQTEYFSLATVFCVVTWKNIGSEKRNQNEVPDPIPNENPHICCNNSCWFSWNKWITRGVVSVLLILTIISICYFYAQMKSHQYTAGVWIFICQQFTLQLILVVAEMTFYFRHMIKMDSALEPPHHFQLDTMMLSFTLLPLGVLFALRVFPDIVQLEDVQGNHLTNSEPLWIFINLFIAFFNFFQVAFQAVFISQLYCRLNYGGLKTTWHFIGFLAGVNFCIWLSWTWECKLLSIHGRSFKIFGVVEWIVIVYATVPLVLFCFAHSTTCFLEIMRHVNNHHQNSGNENTVDIDENQIVLGDNNDESQELLGLISD